jgi:acyl-CoA synthetase (AMP-forming)/AMP-acid ligase II
MPSEGTLVRLLRARAESQPQQIAFTFLTDGERADDHLSYGELDRRARAIAAALQDRTTVGSRALLLYPPGYDYIAAFFGCLYAGVLAVPLFPPRNERAMGRISNVIQDAAPSTILTTADLEVGTKHATGCRVDQQRCHSRRRGRRLA